MEKSLPTKFQIGGKTINIEIDNNLDRQEILGQATCYLNKITVAAIYKGEEIPFTSQEHSLWHEIVHIVFDNVGRPDLSKDETLVESVSTLLHQVINTMEYEIDAAEHIKQVYEKLNKGNGNGTIICDMCKDKAVVHDTHNICANHWNEYYKWRENQKTLKQSTDYSDIKPEETAL